MSRCPSAYCALLTAKRLLTNVHALMWCVVPTVYMKYMKTGTDCVRGGGLYGSDTKNAVLSLQKCVERCDAEQGCTGFDYCPEAAGCGMRRLPHNSCILKGTACTGVTWTGKSLMASLSDMGFVLYVNIAGTLAIKPCYAFTVAPRLITLVVAAAECDVFMRDIASIGRPPWFQTSS